MGIFKKALDEANSGPVIGQSVHYQDRDFADEHPEPIQLTLPFEPPVQKEKRDDRVDELFNNFRIVLKGRDVSIHHKLQTALTLLSNYKNGDNDISSRSHTLLVEILTDYWNGL